jgi:hypothetical protein
VIAKSEKDRYRCMAQVNTLAGVTIPFFVAAKHGHSIPSVSPMRAGLEPLQNIEVQHSEIARKVTHETSVEAASGVARTSLRNDFRKDGRLGGRTGIMCDPFDCEDVAKNRYLQRESRPAQIVIEMDVWWALFGSQATNDVGVRVHITGAGAVLFANVNQTIATVIPIAAFEEIMMHHAVDGEFAKQSS